MSKLSQNENRDISKLLTHQLVKEVTKSMNTINFGGFESKVYSMIMELLEKPIRTMHEYEEIMTRMGESLRKNIRRTHELDFVCQKYQRAAAIVETFEARYME